MSHVLESTVFDPSRLLLEETLFHCANGYLGVRGNFEEGYPEGLASVRGSYINAFYDTHPIEHPERLYGFPETGEKIVNVTDAQGIVLIVGGERVVLEPGRTRGYRRSLDLGTGVASRSFVWRSSTGTELAVGVRRLVSLSTRELFAVEYSVAALASALDLELIIGLDGDVENFFDPSDPRVSGSAFKPLEVLSSEASASGRGGRLYVESRTRSTAVSLGVLSDFSCEGGSGLEVGALRTATGASARLLFHLEPGEVFRLTRKNFYADSRRHGRVAGSVRAIAARLDSRSFEELAAEQAEILAGFWKRAGVEIGGDGGLDEGLRFNLYQLLQSAPCDGASSIPAKGLSGEGYEGHYFWDAEIYMLPFFCYTNPALARGMLMYRHSTLEGARAHAREMGQKRGAAFPWRTIAGRECSAYYPSGSAQYHINADIAYAAWRYYEATADLGFLVEGGAELLLETARLWLALGHPSPEGFRIEAVTGPDEYTCIVDNNYYTNAMAAFNLEKALEARAILASQAPRELSALELRLGLGEEERTLMARAAASMYLPHDRERDVSPQDDGFLRKAPWDFAGTPADHYPLLLHYHHLTLRRFQVCKQADAVLAHFLLPGLAAESTVRNSYAYYEGITTHDSSLSYAAFAAMAARLGDAEKALRYFAETVRLDLDDAHGNTKDGLHAANMGGTWLALVFGFGGFRPLGEAIGLDPVLPRAWTGLSFRIAYRGRSVLVRSRREGAVPRTEVTLEAGEAIRVEHGSGSSLLSASSPLELPPS